MLLPLIFKGRSFLVRKSKCNVEKLKRIMSAIATWKKHSFKGREDKRPKGQWASGGWPGPQHSVWGPTPLTGKLGFMHAQNTRPEASFSQSPCKVTRATKAGPTHALSLSVSSVPTIVVAHSTHTFKWIHEFWCTDPQVHNTGTFPSSLETGVSCSWQWVCHECHTSVPGRTGAPAGSRATWSPVWKSECMCPARCSLCNTVTWREVANHTEDARPRGHQMLQK